MKINQLKIENFLGIRHMDLNLDAPITLFAGKNGSGKSSIAEAVRLVLSKEYDRVKLKKEFANMVSDGQKKGLIEIIAEYGDDGKTTRFNVDLPQGPAQYEQINEFMPFVLDPKKFAGLSPQERRSLLFKLTGCESTQEHVRQMMLERGCDVVKIERILPMIRSGFDAGHDEAKKSAREAKAIWKSITKENYGKAKGDAWKAEKPDLPEKMTDDKEVGEVDANIKAIMEQIGSLREKQKSIKRLREEIPQLTEQVGLVDSLEKTCEIQSGNIEQYKKEMAVLRERAEGVSAPEVFHCPCCDAELMFQVDELKPYHFEGKECDKEARAELMRREEGLKKLIRAHNGTEDRFLSAKNAADRLEYIKNQIDEAPDYGKDITRLQVDVSALEEKKRGLKKALDEQNALISAANEADKKTKAALEAHIHVEGWLEIANALAPDGIPAELLSNALSPFNMHLTLGAKITGWKCPMIRDDMGIIADGRSYQMLSESEKWRVDALIAEAISSLSGLKMIVLDRFDVLHPLIRGSVMIWLSNLAEAGDIETAIVLGTMKSAPAKLPENVMAYWIENGRITNQEAKAA